MLEEVLPRTLNGLLEAVQRLRDRGADEDCRVRIAHTASRVTFFLETIEAADDE